MSLKPSPIQPVPEETARIARAAFRRGNPLLKLRDELGPIFADADFADLFPRRGQPGLAPWRLALVTLLQFRENLADRQAAEAVRARIDWKYLLGLELTDPGFDASVLCEFRARLLKGGAEERLLETLLARCRELGLLKARGRQRTDATHVLAAIRMLNRLELVAETLRAALNELATVAPDWLRGAVPEAWSKRYARRIEDDRLPRTATEREAYARTVGEDGFALLDRLDGSGTPAGLRSLPQVAVLRQVWARHFARDGTSPPGGGGVQLRPKEELPPAAAGIESPYDPEARYRTRSGVAWAGYIVHLSETCEVDAVNLLTHVMTTPATVHEARCTAAIHRALAEKGLPPGEHLVDAAYVDAELLVRSREELGIDLVGPPRVNPTWQAKVAGGYGIDRFEIDWERERARCPQRGGCPRPGAAKSTTPACRTSRSCSAGPTAPPAQRGPRARGPSIRPGTSSCSRGPSTRRSRSPGSGSRRRRGGSYTPGGPGSRAPSRRGCAPSGCAAAVTVVWPRPTCSTWRPRPRSISVAWVTGSGRPRVPPPAPRASPHSPPEPNSPAVSEVLLDRPKCPQMS
jgi:transposase